MRFYPTRFLCISFCILLLFFSVLFFFLQGRKTFLPTVERRFPVMGTVCAFRLTGEAGKSMEEMNQAADAIQDTFYKMEKLCNIFDEKSALSEINRKIKDYKIAECPGELWEIFREAGFFYSYTCGAFDVSISPLMRLWGFYRKKGVLPASSAIAETRKNTGWDKFIFDGKKRTVALRAGSLAQMDLGGIAKGYALDKAAEKAAEMGIKRGLLDLGGNLRSLPLPPQKDRKNFLIGIRDPLGGSSWVENVEMPNNMSMATSGNYERYVVINNTRYTHILDARTGYPVTGMLSVTVLTSKGIHSDALSTSIFILGEDFAEKVCKEFPSTSVLLFREENGKIIRRGWGIFAKK